MVVNFSFVISHFSFLKTHTCREDKTKLLRAKNYGLGLLTFAVWFLDRFLRMR